MSALRDYGEVTPLILRVLERRCALLGRALTDRDLEQFSWAVERVSFVSLSDRASGRMDGEERVLYLDRRLQGHLREYLARPAEDPMAERRDAPSLSFACLAHEVLHGASLHRTGDGHIETGIARRFGTGLNEAINEAAADRIVFPADAQHFHLTAQYARLSFVVPMLAPALGISTEELLRCGITDSDAFAGVFVRHFPGAGEEMMRALGRIIYPLDVITDLSFVHGERFAISERRNAFSDAVCGLYALLQERIRLADPRLLVGQEAGDLRDFERMGEALRLYLAAICERGALTREDAAHIRGSAAVRMRKRELSETFVQIAMLPQIHGRVPEGQYLSLCAAAGRGELHRSLEYLARSRGIATEELRQGALRRLGELRC